MAKTDPRELAFRALLGAVADSAPRPLLGSKALPGIFTGAGQATKQAAALCLAEGWVEPTGTFVGQGRTRKELHRITPAGAREAIEQGETAALLRDMLAALDQKRDLLVGVKSQLDAMSGMIGKQRDVLERILDRVIPPNLDELLGAPRGAGPVAASPAPAAQPDGWLDGALSFLERYQREHPYQHCPLPELYERAARPRRLSIGQFHDGLRKLAADGRIRLHPFTGAAYQLQNEQYALLAGQEIKYYAEHLGRAATTHDHD